MAIDELTLHWLAGLLEGEGSFRAGMPSKPNQPMISLQMTDEDIIAKVAEIFAMSYRKEDRDKSGEKGWKPVYITLLRSRKAFEWMQTLRPLMGTRRQAQIDRALACYQDNRFRALTPEQIAEIKDRASKGESPFWLAKEYGISKTLAYYIKDGYTYQNKRGCSSAVEHLPSKQGVMDSISITRSENNYPVDEPTLYWLAGLLEGEGSFLAPFPSRPNSPVISMMTTDEDVIQRVADIFNVKHQSWQAKKPNAKLAYLARIRGHRAVQLMHDLRPLMGQRRQSQIDRALNAANSKLHVQNQDNAGKTISRRGKLEQKDLNEIQQKLRNGVAVWRVASEYNVSSTTIYQIRKHTPGLSASTHDSSLDPLTGL